MRRRPLAGLTRTRSILLGLLGSLSILFIWHVVVSLGIVRPLYLPTPERVVEAALDVGPSLLIHLASTLSTVIVGFSSGVLLGFMLALILRQFSVMRGLLTPMLESWRPVPAAALVPFFILWFGYSWWGKCALVMLATFLVVVVSAAESIDQLNPIYLRASLSFGGSNWRFLWWGARLAIIPTLIGPMRVALAISLSTTVISEYMGAVYGLGKVMNVALNTFATHTLVLCAILLGLLGASLDMLLRFALARLARWSSRAADAIEFGPSISL
jgi:taurine transport system permease protein